MLCVELRHERAVGLDDPVRIVTLGVDPNRITLFGLHHTHTGHGQLLTAPSIIHMPGRLILELDNLKTTENQEHGSLEAHKPAGEDGDKDGEGDPY